MHDLEKYIRSIPDFPKPGIQFKDITTLLQNPTAFKQCLDAFENRISGKVDVVVGTESRGFIFGAPLADRLGVGFVPVRKPGKLPAETISEEYALEYGTDKLEIHTDAIRKGDKVVIIDDLLATGGTMQATTKLVERLGGEIVHILFLIELEFLQGRERLRAYSIDSLITF
ncbi:MAG: adenine phosphoribosyltransferase [Calditrichaeota bacterium]|nr:MAG: adenine phosphoribosyltransferase [Calditrichota bacterium]